MWVWDRVEGLEGRVCTVRVGGQGLHLSDVCTWRKEPIRSYWELGLSESHVECAKSEGSDAFWIRNARELETLQAGRH